MDIPFPLSSSLSSEDSTDLPYTILFDDGTTASVPLSKMADLIPPPPLVSTSHNGVSALLPPFLQLNSKITYEHDGQYHKGYLGQHNGVYRFSFKSHVNKCKEDWGVPLPNLPSTWVDLCVEGILVPGHLSHSFLRSPTSDTPTTFDPVASFVSAVNLHRDCPPSLLKALADTHPDRHIWMDSFLEEKRGIQSLDTYTKLTLGEYRALHEKGAPRAIPTMCVLTIKKDENLRPLRAKSRIVVLGNHEDRIWKKSDKFAPVLRQDSLRFLTSMAVASRRPLRQGDCKNAFAKVFFRPMKSLSSVLPAAIPKQHQTNIGFSSVPVTACAAALATGAIKSKPFFAPLVSLPRSRIRVSTLVSSRTPLILPRLLLRRHSPLGCMWTTLFTSPRILRLKLSSAVSSWSGARLISWGLSNGFLGFTSAGGSCLPQSTSILTNLALPLISSNSLLFRHEPRHIQLPHIVLGYPLIRSLLLQMQTIHRLKFVVKKLSRALSAASAGCRLQHDPIWLLLTHSSLLTQINPRQVT